MNENIPISLTTGSCIACGNRMTGSSESFVVATAEVGVTAPEGYIPQQVEALHLHKGGDKTAPPLANRIADILVEDHIALMAENKQLRERLAQPEQEPVAWVTGWHDGHCVIRAANPAAILPIGVALYTTPPRREWVGLTDEVDELAREMVKGDKSVNWLALAIEAKLREKNNA